MCTNSDEAASGMKSVAGGGDTKQDIARCLERVMPRQVHPLSFSIQQAIADEIGGKTGNQRDKKWKLG